MSAPPSPPRSPAHARPTAAPELNASLGSIACAYPSCGTHSFLPTTCSCLLTFCPAHALPPLAHDCPVALGTAAASGNNLAAPGERHRFEQKFQDLLPDPKRRVDRTAEDLERAQRRERARIVLARHEVLVARQRAAAGTPALSQTSAASVDSSKADGPTASKKKKLSPALELMRLKQKAKSADPSRKNVELADKLFLNVEHWEADKLLATQELWVAKVSTTSLAVRSPSVLSMMLADAVSTTTSSRSTLDEHSTYSQMSLAWPT